MTGPVRRSSTVRYGTFPTTADVGLWARGATTAELFEALGLGLFAVMTDLRKVRPIDERAVSASGSDPVALVASFLNELLLQSADGFLARSVRARPVGTPPTAVVATLRGETTDPTRHVRKIEVKAATLHRLEVRFDPPEARVILDI